MNQENPTIAIVHADESCLGNGREGSNPGGAASLIEIRTEGCVSRHDLYLSSPATTNNRMALGGAIATIKELLTSGKELSLTYVSDSQYLVKGMTEWIHNWQARGWKRKGGKIENLELWKDLYALSNPISINWVWVRGHAGHAKNEYADFMAVRAAANQLQSNGLVRSEFEQWLADKQHRGQFVNYDADKSLRDVEAEIKKST